MSDQNTIPSDSPGHDARISADRTQPRPFEANTEQFVSHSPRQGRPWWQWSSWQDVVLTGIYVAGFVPLAREAVFEDVTSGMVRYGIFWLPANIVAGAVEWTIPLRWSALLSFGYASLWVILYARAFEVMPIG